jgi:hypothetical protein
MTSNASYEALLDHFLLTEEVRQLIVDYWDEVDARGGAQAHEFYVEDAVFQKMRNKAEIKAFYDWRRSRGERASFHLVNNLRVSEEAGDRIVANYVMTLFAADGTPPLDVRAPASISAATETFVRLPSGELKIVSKVLKLTFRGDEPTTIMPNEILDTMRQNKAG